MTVEFSEYLIGLDKYIVDKGEILTYYKLDIEHPMNFRMSIADDSLEQNLLIDIKESEKKDLKLSLHYQDNSSENGLLRVDYNGRHLNPVEIIPTLPELFKDFAGQWLDSYPGHIHYVVEGYRPLAWAIPLEFDEFPIKELRGREDYIRVLSEFFRRINLKTTIEYNHQLSLL